MKIYQKLLGLLSVASTIYGEVFFNIDLNSIEKTAECQNDFENENFKPCLALFNYKDYADDFSKVCNIVYSEPCQEFYENPLLFLPNCQGSVALTQALAPSVVNICLSRVNAGCETDEDGNLCPISQSFLNSDAMSQTYGMLFEETCQSQKCTTALIDAFTAELEYSKDAEALSFASGHLDDNTATVMQQFIDDLSSDKCDMLNTHIRCIKSEEDENAAEPVTSTPSKNVSSDASTTLSQSLFMMIAGLTLTIFTLL